MQKLFASDLDGTLSHSSRSLDFKIKEKLEEFYSKGWSFLFSTGRSSKYAEDLISVLSCPYFLAAQNGTFLIDPNKKIINQYCLSKELLPFLEKEANKFNISWWIESGHSYKDVIFLCDNDYFFHEFKEVFSNILNSYFPKENEKKIYVRKLQNSLKDYPYSNFAVAKTIGPISTIENIANKLRESLHDICNITNIAVPRQPNFGMIHLTHKKASKDQVLSRLIDNIFPNKNVFKVVAGDDQNDYEMIKNGHFKVVMATAPKFMLEIADYVAPSAEELGIIKALEEGEKMYEKKLSNRF